jgi:hypothetical protein
MSFTLISLLSFPSLPSPPRHTPKHTSKHTHTHSYADTLTNTATLLFFTGLQARQPVDSFSFFTPSPLLRLPHPENATIQH